MKIRQIAQDRPVLVGLDEIDERPGPYCMSFAFDLNKLRASIEKAGLLNPPLLVRKRAGGMETIAGYRRILALKSLHREEAPCRVLEEFQLAPLDGILMNLHDNLATRPFNDVEKGMILKRLAPHVSRDELLKGYMPLLNLPSRDATLDLFLGLEDLPPITRTAVAEGRLSLQTVMFLLDRDSVAQSLLAQWILDLRLNANQQRKFIEYTEDISTREGKDIPELLEEGPLADIPGDEKSNTPQKAKGVIDFLRERRFPVLTRSEKTFRKNVARLRLPDGVKIQHPPFFEGPHYSLEIAFKDGKALKEKIDDLSRMDHLMEITDPWPEDP
jgi:ParB-like chromosome segregation protein Spo0J